jgi:hypothetical protein
MWGEGRKGHRRGGPAAHAQALWADSIGRLHWYSLYHTLLTLEAKPAATKMVLSLILLLCRRMRDVAYEAGLRRGERCSTLHPARLPRDERVVEKG